MMITDHNGKEYKSMMSMCQEWGVDYDLVRSRILRGMSVKDALTKPKNYDHFTKEQDDFLRENYSKMTIIELSEKFHKKFGANKNTKAIQKHCALMGLNKWSKIGVEGYTKEENNWLKENAKNHSCEELSEKMIEIFGRKHTAGSIKQHCRVKLNITKGHGIVYDTTDKRKCEIGTIRRHGKMAMIKIDETSGYKQDGWVAYGKYLYEEAYGKLPKGYQIIHLDGNSDNFNLDNLMAISHKEHAILSVNHWHGKGEITKAGKKYADLILELHKTK